MRKLRIFHGWSARSRIAIGQPTLLTRAWSICGGIRVVFCDKLLWWRHRRTYWSRPIFHGVENNIHLSSVQLAHPNIGLSTHFALGWPIHYLHFAIYRFNHSFTWNRGMTTWSERYTITCHTIDCAQDHLILQPQQTSSPYGQRDPRLREWAWCSGCWRERDWRAGWAEQWDV